jgi:hypothetical protein
MTVGAIIGALRGCGSREPEKVLEYLNRVLYGQIGGFRPLGALRLRSELKTLSPVAGERAVVVGTRISRPGQR